MVFWGLGSMDRSGLPIWNIVGGAFETDILSISYTEATLIIRFQVTGTIDVIFEKQSKVKVDQLLDETIFSINLWSGRWEYIWEINKEQILSDLWLGDKSRCISLEVRQSRVGRLEAGNYY